MKRFINDVKKFFNYTVFSSKAELKSEVADSFLSWLWWILDPLLYMLVYSFIAIIVFKSGEPYFPVFVFIGMNCWTFFSKTFKASVKLVQAKKMIVTKVYIPKFMFILEKIGVYGFKMLVSYILTAILMIIYQVPISWRMLYALPIMLVLLVGTFAASTIIMHFGVFAEDLTNLVNIAMRFIFYLTGVFFDLSTRIHNVTYRTLLLDFNPLANFIYNTRNVLIYGKAPVGFWTLGWFFIGLRLCALGIRTIYKYENTYVKVMR